MNQKKPFFKTGGGLLLLGFVIVSLIGIPVTVFLLQQQQIIKQEAWKTSQSASAVCGPDGKVVITASFSNTEPPGAQWAMNVVVKDNQTGLTANIGTVNPGETKSGTISTTLTSANAGSVIYSLTWTDGRSGVDSRTANYQAVPACTAPTETPTPTPTVPVDTPTPTLPEETPTPTPTVPVDTPTPTTETPTPTTSTPTPTTVISTETPTPPGATETPGPTATPTNPLQNTATTAPQPTIAPSGPADMLFGFGLASIVLILLGGLLFILL